MTFCFLIYSYFPYGGQQRDFHRIVSECIARGHEVRIYTHRWQGPRIENANITLVPVRAFNRTRLYKKFTHWVMKDLERTTVDAVVGFNKMPGLDIYFAADPCFAEKALTQRGFYYRFSLRFRHFIDYERAVFRDGSNTRVLLLSRMQQRSFIRFYPESADRLYPVPPGIDPDRKATAHAPDLRQELRKRLGLEPKKLLILQVGSGFRVKGVDRSLRACAALPDEIRERVCYILIGQDKPGPYLRLARKLGIGDAITILPGRDDIPRFMFGADLLLHPAYSESAGYVLLEAVIAGLPVLTTASCGYAEHIINAGAGEVCNEPFSQEDLNRRLLQMLTSSERPKWSANGIAYGKREDLYSLPKSAMDLIEKFASEPADTRGREHAVSQ
ncbi:MAG: glycosyltransferase family 4 protein [Pseudohongiellaceae bacterium]